MNSESQFKLSAVGNVELSAKSNAVLKVAADAAVDLNEYRNSLVHGYLISFGGINAVVHKEAPVASHQA